MDIQQIIKSCLNNERTAQRQLFEQYAPYIYTICRRYARNNEDAKENMQDCFVRIFNKLDLFDPEKGNFKSWIAKLTVNESLNKIKTQSKIIPLANVDITELEIADKVQLKDSSKQELLIQGMQQLPEGYRNVLNLYIFERKSHKEIAGLLGIAESSSRSQLTRAKVLLESLIKNKKLSSYGT